MWEDKDKSKGQLLNELAELRRRFAELDKSEDEHKRAGKQLREASLYVRSLIEVSLDPLVTISPEGKITDLNKATELVTGFSREQLLGRDFSDYFTEPEKARESYHEVFTKGFVKDYPLAVRHTSGEVTYVQYNATVYKNEAGEVQGVFAAARDITKLKRTEEKLKQTLNGLERSNKELEQFAFIVSHDLQEPLRMVASFTQLLEESYKGKLDKDADEFIYYIVDGTTRMQRMIEDVLMYSRVGTRGKPFEPTDCEKVLDQGVTNLKVAIEENDATVTHDSLPTIMADASQMVELIQNLIGNAIKFRKKEDPPHVHVSAEKKDNEWVFSVRDNGIGIAPEFFGRLFNIFQRLHGREEYPGTGIGLAICKKIVERHGGRIWVESEPGKGSTFYFTIPAERGERT